MPSVILVRVNWDRTAIPLKIASRFYTLHVAPEPGHPFGRRGLGMAGAWRQLAGPQTDGMVFLDGDVAIDPGDLAAMLNAIDREPEHVQVAPVKLWPSSTKLQRWVHGHGNGGFFHDQDPDQPDYFGLSFTYLPRRLMEDCIRHNMDSWHYPGVDTHIRRRFAALGMSARVVRQASPKHLNY
jgi:hypothetical protein